MKRIFTTVFFAAFLLFGASEAFAKINLFAYSRPVPDTKIYYQDGTSYKLSDFKGKFVIALFWSRTCVPCIRELKSLNKFYNKTKDENIKLVMISPLDEWNTHAEQRDFLSKYKAIDVDFFVDNRGDLASAFGIFSYPHSVLINQDGEEIGRIRGQMDWNDEDIIQYIYDLRDGKIKGPK